MHTQIDTGTRRTRFMLVCLGRGHVRESHGHSGVIVCEQTSAEEQEQAGTVCDRWMRTLSVVQVSRAYGYEARKQAHAVYVRQMRAQCAVHVGYECDDRHVSKRSHGAEEQHQHRNTACNISCNTTCNMEARRCDIVCGERDAALVAGESETDRHEPETDRQTRT
jgi:hypothetical protein